MRLHFLTSNWFELFSGYQIFTIKNILQSWDLLMTALTGFSQFLGENYVSSDIRVGFRYLQSMR